MELKDLENSIEEVSTEYATRNSIDRNSDWLMLKLTEEIGELTQSYLKMTGQARIKDLSKEMLKLNFEEEVADVFCHILLISKRYNIDLADVIHKKWLSGFDNKK